MLGPEYRRDTQEGKCSHGAPQEGASFCNDHQKLKNIYILFVRSILEQSATVWHSSLTEENRNDLERVQKTALKVILGDKYITYKNALNILDILTLNDQRDKM